MSTLALARKWRPQTFSQLLGQEHITQTLVNALNQKRIHHAYLFTGTRGVGKTSVARILAKALNCDKGISADPCLQCDACKAIEQGRFIDLIEIDGASKTRVEDTRELLDNVQYAPTSGRFKIYLIDEVHMLSQHSFNALLKTLEEPPPHVKFILATTDPQKLPMTVLSRCLQFTLHHVSDASIKKQLQLILADEQKEYESEVLDLLAHAAQGSMRDALSLLDQAIISTVNQLTAQEVKKLLGYTQRDYATQLLQALLTQNPAMIVDLTEQIAIEGGHFKYVLDEILNHLHHMTVYQHTGEHPLLNIPHETIILANQCSAEDIQLFYQIALNGKENIHWAPTLAIGFRMTLLRMLTFRPAPKAPLPPLAFQTPQAITGNTQDLTSLASAVNEIAPEAPQLRSPPSYTHEDSDWHSIILQLNLTGLAHNALEHAEFISKIEHTLTLKIANGHNSLFTPTTITKIEAALTTYYQQKIKLVLKKEEHVHDTPARQKERDAQQKQQSAEHALSQDPVFQQIQQDFSAELVRSSIVPLKDNI
jgi:DNA polymerase III subunit gamma/tau